MFSQGIHVIDKRCNWLSLFLSSLKETMFLFFTRYVLNLFLTVAYDFHSSSDSLKESRISSVSSPTARIRELTCFCSVFSSRSEASLIHSNLLIQLHCRPPFWLAKGELFGKLITWHLNHVSRRISLSVTLQSINTKLVTVAPLSFVCRCSVPIPLCSNTTTSSVPTLLCSNTTATM